MAITALPSPPQRGQSQSEFTTKADALLNALPTFVTEANALQTDVNNTQSAAASSATNSAISASASASSATNSANSASASASSATNSTNSASAAASSATAAASSATAAANSASSFDINTISVSNALASASDIGLGVSTRIAVDQAINGQFKWQSVANFFNKAGQALHLNADRGRYIVTASGMTLIAGNIYAGNTWSTAYAVNMPALANTYSGDTITILNTSLCWGSYPLTINCAAGVYLHTGASAESLVLDTGGVTAITLICNSTNSSTFAYWSLG